RGDPVGRLRAMAAERRLGAPCPPTVEVLQRIVRRCLEPDPARRYQTAAELADALEGCREHRRVLQETPPAGRLTRAVMQHPFALGLALIFLPHVLGSAVNITYNSLRIVGRLTAAQQATFQQLVLGYNLIVYSACLVLLYVQLAPIYRTWRRLNDGDLPDPATLDAVRQRVLRLPLWTIALSCAGWLPGGLLFPLGIHWLSGPIGGDVFGHFLLSFTVSGLTGLPYSL